MKHGHREKDLPSKIGASSKNAANFCAFKVAEEMSNFNSGLNRAIS